MSHHSSLRHAIIFSFISTIAILLFVACAPASSPVASNAPMSSSAASKAEGLLISNFEQDISIWQGYSQDTETIVKPGETPPNGFVNVAKFHSKYTDRWVKPMTGFSASTEQVKEGKTSGKWENTIENNRIVARDIPHDWSGYKYLTFWAYSVVANKAAIELVAYSELDATSDDDYYKLEVLIDWTGWRKFEIPLKEFTATRTPVGWNKIDYFKIASSGWSHNPLATTTLYFDAMRLSNTRTESTLAVKLDKRHPNLFLNPTEIAEIKKKIAQYDWAKIAYQTISSNAFAWSTRPIKLPDTGGGYYHAGGADYEITQKHYDHANAARDCALIFQLTGEKKYAAKAQEILLAYSEKYLTYEIHDKDGKTGDKASAGGRATPQGINEATFVIPLAWAYDLIYDTLAPAEREKIEKNILRPAAELLMINNEGRHNHQTWYNAGVGVIGFALADEEYVGHALNKNGSGFFYQMKNSVTADGLWYEGAMHYQFYVLQALMPLAEAAYHAGIDVYKEPGYQALFNFPIAYADASGRLPVINDGREVFLGAADRNRYYETAYRRIQNPLYANVLRASERTSLESLVYGVNELSQPTTTAWRSTDFAKSGLAVLRTGKDFNAKQVVLNYMGYEGGHSHPDQLGLVFFGLGRTLAPDAGSIKYEDPVHNGWYKQTVSHNTLVVNSKSQARAPIGSLDAFASGTQLQVARASANKAYGSVNQSRTLLLTTDYLVDLFQVACPWENQYDWVYHNYGDFSTELNLQTATVSKGNGSEYLTNVRGAKTDTAWRADWTIASDQKVRLYMLGASGTQVIAAGGLVAAPTNDETSTTKVPLTIVRRTAKNTRYGAIIEPYSTNPVISEMTPMAATADGKSVNADDATGLRIHRGKNIDTLLVSDSRGAKKFGDYSWDGTLAWMTSTGNDLQAIYLAGGSQFVGNQWTVEMESLVSASDAAPVSVYIERDAAKRLVVQNSGNALTTISLQGLVDGTPQAYELHDDGTRGAKVNAIETGAGYIRFFLNPRKVYEIVE